MPKIALYNLLKRIPDVSDYEVEKAVSDVVTKVDIQDIVTKSDLAGLETRLVKQMYAGGGIVIASVGVIVALVGLMIKFL